MLQALGYIPVDAAQNDFSEQCETGFFHFPPMAYVNGTDDVPTVAGAADRPTYAALNMYRASGGNPQCGPVSAVLSRRFVRDRAVGAPVDTGAFFGTCGLGGPDDPPGGDPGMFTPCPRHFADDDDDDDDDSNNPGECNSPVVNCSAWPYDGGRPLGTPGNLAHLLIPYLQAYNHTAPIAGLDNYPSLNLARLVMRLCSRKTYRREHWAPNGEEGDGSGGASSSSSTHHRNAPLRLNFMENTLGYFELNPAVTVKYPEGVAMMVGMFEVLFGTDAGRTLQAWCKQRGWPLAWAHNPLTSLWDAGGPSGGAFPVNHFAVGLEAANERVLDPDVLPAVPAGWNCTGNNATTSTTTSGSSSSSSSWFADAAAAFDERWDAVNATLSPAAAAGGGGDWESAAARRLYYDAQWALLLRGGQRHGDDGKLEGLANSLLAVEPPFAGACADADGCFAVRVLDSACICPPN